MSKMTDPLTILTWFWKQPNGRTAYSAETVNVWADMVRRNLKMPHRIACVTEHPEGIDSDIAIIAPPGDFEDIRLPTWGEDKPQCLRRIAMFRRDAADIFGPRFVAMDMDSIVMGPLDPLFDRDDDFIMFKGTTAHRPYNGSLLMMNAGARPQVHESLTPEGAIKAGFRYVGSDQAWISSVLGQGEKTWDATDGVHAYNSVRNGNSDTRILFFFGNPKPWDLLSEDRIAKYYRKAGKGRAIVLCGGPATWSDAVAELEQGKPDAVFAVEAVAPFWPGNIEATAAGPKEAAAKAFLLGYENIVLCGQPEEDQCASLA
jgi:hypothetical protein